jgi:hypothetical protein
MVGIKPVAGLIPDPPSRLRCPVDVVGTITQPRPSPLRAANSVSHANGAPMIGVAATAIGSAYAGLKGLWGEGRREECEVLSAFNPLAVEGRTCRYVRFGPQADIV